MIVDVYSGYDERGNVIKTLEQLTFTAYGKTFTIPAGYESSGFSCPRFLWPLISPAIDPNSLVASIIHDWLYEDHVLTRAQADRYFRWKLINDGFPRWKAELSYIGVRVFGGSHWSHC